MNVVALLCGRKAQEESHSGSINLFLPTLGLAEEGSAVRSQHLALDHAFRVMMYVCTFPNHDELCAFPNRDQNQLLFQVALRQILFYNLTKINK